METVPWHWRPSIGAGAANPCLTHSSVFSLTLPRISLRFLNSLSGENWKIFMVRCFYGKNNGVFFLRGDVAVSCVPTCAAEALFPYGGLRKREKNNAGTGRDFHRGFPSCRQTRTPAESKTPDRSQTAEWYAIAGSDTPGMIQKMEMKLHFTCVPGEVGTVGKMQSIFWKTRVGTAGGWNVSRLFLYGKWGRLVRGFA